MHRFAAMGLVALSMGGCVVASDAGEAPRDEQTPAIATTEEALHTTFRGPRPVGISHSGPFQIVTDATTAYWLNGNLGFAGYTTSITKAAKAGFGTRTTVVDLGSEEPRGMVLSGSTLYWATAARVGAVNVDGSGFRVIASGLNVTAESIAQDATYVYYVNAGEIERVPKAGGDRFAYPQLFHDAQELVVDGGDLYVIDDVAGQFASGSVSRVSTSTGERVFLTTGQARPRFLAVSGDYVFWGNRGVISDCCEYQNYTDVDIRRMPKVGGSVTTIRNLTTTLNGLSVTSEHVYWSEGILGVGNVRRITRSGGSSTYVVTNEGHTRRLAADTDGVIYTRAESDGDGGVLKFIPRADIRGSQCTTTPARAGDAVAPLGLSATGTWIFFTEPGKATIRRLWRNGSSQSELVASGHPSAFALIANDRSLFWLQNTGSSWEAWHHFIDGLGAEPYMGGTGIASDLATDGRNHFVVEREGNVFAATVALDTQRLLTHVDGTAERVSLSTSYVYVSHTTSTGAAAVSRVSKTAASGTAPRRIVTVSGRTAGDVVYDNDYVYLVTFGGTSHSLVRAPSSGGTAQVLWTGSSRPYELSATDNYIYMTTNAATLIRVSKTGGGSTTLADRAGTAAELDTDGKCVSFAVRTSSGGEIVKVAE